MTTPALRCVLLWLVPALAVCVARTNEPFGPPASDEAHTMQIHYLEIVTPDVDATCAVLAEQHGVEFGEPRAELGDARIASLAGGGRLGVRGPMRADEEPVVRPYRLVDDIESAVEVAVAAGAEVALPPTEIPEAGKFAIYFQGGIQHGLWQR